MGTEIAVYERRLDADVMPRLSQILMATPDIPAMAFKAAFLESLAQNPKLTDCSMTSVLMSATTLACLGVMPGPFLGQGWLIPRSLKGQGKVAVAQLGYKGLNTIAGRSGRSIEAGVVRRADRYELREGSRPNLDIFRNMEDTESAILFAYSQLFFNGDRSSLKVIPMKELMAIKNKNSKAATNEDEEAAGFSPWNDSKVGLPAMCEKTACLRQRRSIPMGLFHYAGAMDDLQEQGKPSWIIPDENSGHPVIVTGNNERLGPPPPSESIPETAMPKNIERPDFIIWLSPKKTKKEELRDITEWRANFKKLIVKAAPEHMQAIREANADVFLALAEAGYSSEVNEITLMIASKESHA